MGQADFVTTPLFDFIPTDPTLTPQELRAAALAGTPAERAEFTRTISISVDGYRHANDFVDALLDRSARSPRPGGLWLLGDGGVGKSFILEAVYRRHPPSESQTKRHCPILSLSFSSRPSESEILLTVLLQLGQNPKSIRYQNNAELMDHVVDAVSTGGALAILFDEAHHLWLNTSAKRVTDRMGGRLGDFLKRFYDRTGLAYIFAGTNGLHDLLDADSQASTRWPGTLRLHPFADDEKFRGLLAALDMAIPMPKPAGLTTDSLASRIFESTKGNFRNLKTLLAQAVYIAASEGAHLISEAHLARAHFLTFCSETTPFD